MELWLDTTDEKAIVAASELGLLSGVTTNPSILSRENSPPEATLKRLLAIQPGYVAAQVTADDLNGMIKQAERLSKLSKDDRMIIKIPAMDDGYKAMAHLKKQGISTLATAVFETKQLFLSSLAGASYCAPYISRIETLLGNALGVVDTMQATIRAQQASIKIMGAAIQTTQQLCDCARLGVGAITVPLTVYNELFNSMAYVKESIAKFREDWMSNPEMVESELFRVQMTEDR